MLEDTNLDEEDLDEAEEERRLFEALTPAYLEWQKIVLQRGRDEGKAEAQCEIALNLLLNGMSCEQVVRTVGLSMKSVVQLAKKKQNWSSA